MLVGDAEGGERSGERVAVELRVEARPRNGPDVNDQRHLRLREHTHERFDRTRGMSDGEERVGHSTARLACFRRRWRHSAFDARFCAEIASAPDIGREQRLGASAHGVDRPGWMMNPFSRLTQPPIVFARAPQSVAGQRQVELLRLVRMGGIFDVRAEEENAAGDRVTDEGAALADPFAEAVVVEETLAEIGSRIGLPPIEFVGQRCDRRRRAPASGARGSATDLEKEATTGIERATSGRATNSRGQSCRKASASPPPASSSSRIATTIRRSGSERSQNADCDQDRGTILASANEDHSRLQVLDLDEGEVEGIGVDHIVLDALAPRVRNMALERRRARAAAGLLQQKVAVGKRNDDVVSLVPMPPVSAAGTRHSVTRTCGSQM